MERVSLTTLFEREAAAFLPGFLYDFNIADFKRRNGHLGHSVGDGDIAVLDGLIAAAARGDGTSRRIGGDRWLMVSRADAADRVQRVLDGYQRADPFVSGWRIWASNGDEERSAEAPLPTVIRRAARCLYTEVARKAELAAAIAALEDNNWSLPINRPHPLSQLAALPSQPWQCVDGYPEQDPACPFCGSRQLTWTDGDDCIYSGDGFCKGCGAEISIRDINYGKPRGFGSHVRPRTPGERPPAPPPNSGQAA
jgi:GGDEF domain-containing protein